MPRDVRPEIEEPEAGIVETADPDTGELEAMRFWLPPGVTAEGLGLERVVLAERGAP